MSSNPNPIDQTVCKRFATVRKKLKLGQIETAKSLGISQSMVSMIEKGTREVNTEILKALFSKFKVSPIYMITGELPIIYNAKEDKTLITTINDTNTELMILKAKVDHLYKMVERLQSA